MDLSSKNRNIGIVLQYIQIGLHIIINLIYTPILLNILGQSEYGLYNLCVSVIAYLNIFSLGFNSGYLRFASKYKSNDDEEGIKRLNGLYLIVFGIIGAISLACGLIISHNASIFLNNSYSSFDLHTAKTLLTILTVNLSLSFPLSVFTSYITIQEKFIAQKTLNIVKVVLSPMLAIGLLFWGYGSIGVVIATTIINLSIEIVNVIYCMRHLKMKFCFNRFEKGLLKDIFVFCIFIAITQVVDQINWQADKIILGKFINASAVAIYAIGSVINNMYISLSSAISGVFTPKIYNIMNNTSVTDEQKNIQLTNLLIGVGRWQFVVLIFVLLGFIFFGKYFILKWAGEGYDMAYYVVLLLITSATFELIQSLNVDIRQAKEKHKFPAIFMLCVAVFNIMISIVLVMNIGIIGVAIGTAIATMVNVIVLDIYYYKHCGINMINFWKEILKLIPYTIVPIIVGVLFNVLWVINNPFVFILQVFLFIIVYAISLYLLGINNSEKQAIKSFIKKLKR